MVYSFDYQHRFLRRKALGYCAGALLLSLSACNKAPSAPTPLPTVLSVPIASSSATTTALTGTLRGDAEVPPVSGGGTGSASVTINAQTRAMTWTATYTGLTGSASAAHFHGPAAVGENAAVALPVTGALASPMAGSATLSEAQTNDLLAGKWYFNIHTAAHPNGELRGQLNVQR